MLASCVAGLTDAPPEPPLEGPPELWVEPPDDAPLLGGACVLCVDVVLGVDCVFCEDVLGVVCAFCVVAGVVVAGVLVVGVVPVAGAVVAGPVVTSAIVAVLAVLAVPEPCEDVSPSSAFVRLASADCRLALACSSVTSAVWGSTAASSCPLVTCCPC